jgi:hypothetical protein
VRIVLPIVPIADLMRLIFRLRKVARLSGHIEPWKHNARVDSVTRKDVLEVVAVE